MRSKLILLLSLSFDTRNSNMTISLSPKTYIAPWVVSLTLKGLLYSLLKFRYRNIATNSTYDVQHSNNYIYTKSEVSNFFKNAKMCSKWLHNLQKLQSLPGSLAKGSNHQLYTQCIPEYTTDSWTLTYSQNTSVNYSTHCSPVMPYGIMLHAHH